MSYSQMVLELNTACVENKNWNEAKLIYPGKDACKCISCVQQINDRNLSKFKHSTDPKCTECEFNIKKYLWGKQYIIDAVMIPVIVKEKQCKDHKARDDMLQKIGSLQSEMDNVVIRLAGLESIIRSKDATEEKK